MHSVHVYMSRGKINLTIWTDGEYDFHVELDPWRRNRVGIQCNKEEG
jgi:hypothetical protein